MSNSAQLSDSKKQLLERFLRGEMVRQSREVPISPRSPGEQIPLAPCQRQVWISGQMTYPTPAYNEPLTIHYRGELDHSTLERSFNELIRRHEIWRTSFAPVNGQVMQVVHEDLFISIPLVDLTMLPAAEREAEGLAIATADAKRPFDPGVGPLVRAKLVRMDPQYHRLYLTVHHIVFDALSISSVLLPELQAVYAAFSAGLPSPLPDPRCQYADYALWQERTIANHSMARQKNYWRKQLSEAPSNLRLPFDRQRPAVASYRGGVIKFAFPGDLTTALKRASRTEGVTLYMFLLASFKAVLHRYSGQADIVVGGVANIRRPEFENLIGFFLNTIALRTRPSGELSFHDYLLSVRDTVLEALAHGDMPFDDVVRETHPSREPSRHPLFQVMFAVEPPAPSAGPGWELTTTDVDTGASKFDLYVEAYDLPDGLTGRFSYSSDLFDPATIERMIGHWQTLLAAAINDRTAKLSQLPILTPAESAQLRVSWNGTRCDVPRTTIHGMFEAQASRTPDAIAVVTESEQLTYNGLNEGANRLAHRLRLAGAGPGTIVGLCVGRSSNMVTALLAILKAGAAYVPLDPSFPAERLAFLVSDAQCPLILTERTLDGCLPWNDEQVIYCDEYAGDGANLGLVVGTDDLAYVLYTSGSTGKPKGVEIPHSAVVNFLISMQQHPGFTAKDTLLAVTTLSFDIAALEIYLPLVTGGKLVVATHDDAMDPARLIERIQESACTVMQATPATWRALIDFGWSGFANLKILCGGESLPRDLAQQLLPRCAQLWNMYGPTETTIWSTVHRITSDEGPISIGRPIANTQIFVLDANRNIVPVGVVGELYIGGAGLARGYLRRAELTRERFIQSPFDPKARLYRVGDLGRWLPDGTLECLGRVDDQVKIRGFRIELEEIEAVIAGHNDVHCAAVRAWPDPYGSLSLVAYVVAPPHTDLRRFLQHKLPEYMIPARFVFMDTLPLTPNGKVDRKALAEPLAFQAKPEFVGPANEIEQQISDIWESILDVRPISMHDNFFELGGHSLMVSRVLRRIELEFGTRLSMSALFHAPTIEQLALVVGGTGPQRISRIPRIKEIQANSSRAPLFWIYGGSRFHPLSVRLSQERPFISISLDPTEEEKLPEDCDLADIASCLVRTIRLARPEGPYYLGGWCLAGILSYEVAAQLAADGQEVGLLALVGADNPVHSLSIPPRQILISKMRFHWKCLRATGIKKGVRSIIAHAEYHIGSIRQRSQRGPLTFHQKLLQAVAKYQPEPLKGRLAVFQPVERPDIVDHAAGWRRVAPGNVEQFDIPGDHGKMLEEPHVQSFANSLAGCLRHAESVDNIRPMRVASAG